MKYANYQEYVNANREAAAKRSREVSDSVKEIGPLPKVVKPDRKEAGRESLLRFMLAYGGDPSVTVDEGYVFPMPFCEEQLNMIHSVEEVLKYGGQTSLCIFRGGCKTTICEWGITWAAFYGWQRFCLVVAANAGMARRIVSNLRRMIETYTLLKEDFPEVCYPVEKLENVMQRSTAQKLDGVHTKIKFTADQLVLPTVNGMPSSSAIIQGVGADASFRGLREGAQRPTVVLIDDPQTNKSANSPTQTDQRWENITTSIKGLAGPGVELAMIATITVIKKNDLAEKILKEWGGKRYGILRHMPTNMQAWEDYKDVMDRIRDSTTDVKERQNLINDYYLEHRDVLDEGAVPTWETHFTGAEVSAIQHAMHLYLFSPPAFWSEYMNQPLDAELAVENLKVEDLDKKVRADLRRGALPQETTVITAGIDIQNECLYWLVTAWHDGFNGHVIDYGRYPKGNMKMSTRWGDVSFEERIGASLLELAEELKAKTYRKEGGEEMGITKVIVDANWGKTTQTVRQVCKRVEPRLFIEPTQGWGKGPNYRFFTKSAVVGELRGPEWKKMPLVRSELVRGYVYNTNYWKSFIRSRIQTGAFASGTLTFFGGESQAKLWTHLLAETSQKLAGTYGTIDQWTLIPGQPNHWWDCLIMSAIGASAMKIKLRSVAEDVSKPKRKVNWLI